MKLLAKCGTAATVSALVLSAALPLQAQAQTGPWQFELGAYGWFPGISGETSHGDIDLSTGDVLDALKFAMFANVAGSNGEWGFFTDLMYADIGGTKEQSRDISIGGHPLPAGMTAKLDLDAKTWMWTAVGTYTAISTPEHKLDLIGGLRMIDMTQTLNWFLNGTGNVSISRTGESQVNMTNWDAIIGVRGRAFFDSERTWFVPYYLDMGAGESQFTWQGNLGVGYRFPWGALVASWRYVDYNLKSGSAFQNFSFSGPLIGMAMTY